MKKNFLNLTELLFGKGRTLVSLDAAAIEVFSVKITVARCHMQMIFLSYIVYNMDLENTTQLNIPPFILQLLKL